MSPFSVTFPHKSQCVSLCHLYASLCIKLLLRWPLLLSSRSSWSILMPYIWLEISSKPFIAAEDVPTWINEITMHGKHEDQLQPLLHLTLNHRTSDSSLQSHCPESSRWGLVPFCVWLLAIVASGLLTMDQCLCLKFISKFVYFFKAASAKVHW